jgi:hypothetical protein
MRTSSGVLAVSLVVVAGVLATGCSKDAPTAQPVPATLPTELALEAPTVDPNEIEFDAGAEALVVQEEAPTASVSEPPTTIVATTVAPYTCPKNPKPDPKLLPRYHRQTAEMVLPLGTIKVVLNADRLTGNALISVASPVSNFEGLQVNKVTYVRQAGQVPWMKKPPGLLANVKPQPIPYESLRFIGKAEYNSEILCQYRFSSPMSVQGESVMFTRDAYFDERGVARYLAITGTLKSGETVTGTETDEDLEPFVVEAPM